MDTLKLQVLKCTDLSMCNLFRKNSISDIQVIRFLFSRWIKTISIGLERKHSQSDVRIKQKVSKQKHKKQGANDKQLLFLMPILSRNTEKHDDMWRTHYIWIRCSKFILQKEKPTRNFEEGLKRWYMKDYKSKRKKRLKNYAALSLNK